MTESTAEYPPNDCESQFLVLRKTPYQGSSLIVSGLSPELGQMGFFIRMPGQKSKKNFSYFDLFRLLRVNYRKGKGDLFYCEEAECLADFSALACSYENFRAACWMAKFALANVLPGLSHPRFFRGMLVALQRLSLHQQGPAAVLTGLCLTWLEEAGCLNSTALSAAEMAQCQLLLQMAAGSDMPVLEEDNWQQLWLWSYTQLRQCECHTPAFEANLPN